MDGLMGRQMGEPEDDSSQHNCHGGYRAGWRKKPPLGLPQDDGVEPVPTGFGRGCAWNRPSMDV